MAKLTEGELALGGEYMEKLSERLTSLNNISKNILKYGMLIVLISLIISNNLLKNATDISSLNLVHEFICGNVYAFCEIIVGAIMVDMLIEKDNR